MTSTMKFEKVVQNLLKQTVKSFTLQDLIKHKTVEKKNLFEILSRYPGGGVGFKVYRKTWPKYMYYQIKKADYKGSRTGNLFGVLFKDNKQARLGSQLIRSANKRGIWRYQITQQKQIVLDNGLIYKREDLQNIYKQIISTSNQNSQGKSQANQDAEIQNTKQSQVELEQKQ